MTQAMVKAGALGWALGLAALGLIVGSFVATLVIRWPRRRSVARGRSQCDGCGRTLAAWELVPLASALALRGRCRSCGAAIDPRHWQMEVGCGVIGALAGLVAPGPEGLAGAVFGWGLLALAALDAAEMWLPDALTGPLALAGLAVGAPPLTDRVVGAIAGFALLEGVRRGYRVVRGREGLGGGDPKLFGAIGAWLGWRLLPAVLVLAALAGLAAVLWARLAGREVRRDSPVPFGALLAAAAYPAWLVMVGLGA